MGERRLGSFLNERHHQTVEDFSGGDGQGGSFTMGNLTTLLSALAYGLYAAQLKLEIPTEEHTPMPYLFGLFGALILIGVAPCIAIVHVLKVERFAPPGGETLLALLLNGLFGSVVSNMLLARAMVLASPLVATVGLSLSIPLAIASDVMRGRSGFMDVRPILGTIAVWAGFLGVSAAEPLEKRLGCAKSAVSMQNSPRVVRVVPLRQVS